MQITIEDISPVEKRVEFELPWTDVAPKLDKAYNDLRRERAAEGVPSRQGAARAAREAVQAPGRGRRRPRTGRALARPGDSREPDPAGGAADRSTSWRSSRARRSSSRPGSRSGRRSTPKDYSGIPLTRRPVKVDRRAGRRGARGLPQAADQVQAGRGADRDRRTTIWCWSSCQGRVGDNKVKRRSGRRRSGERRRGAAAGPGQPAPRQARSAATSRSKYDLPTEGLPPEMAGKHVHLQVTIKEARERSRPGARRRAGQGHRRGRDAGGAEGQGARAAASTADKQRIKREMTQALIKELVKRNEFPIAPALVDRYAAADREPRQAAADA